MAFKDYVYESDDATNSYIIRLDSDQADLAGAVVGTPTDAFHVIANQSARKFGISPRHISLRRLVGTAPNEKAYTTRLAIATKAAFDAIAVGSVKAINSINYTVAHKSPESKR